MSATVTKNAGQPSTPEAMRLYSILSRKQKKRRKPKQVAMVHAKGHLFLLIFLCKRQNGKCFWCRREITPKANHCLSDMTRPTVDHLVPRSKSGKNNVENLVASCSECNNKKGEDFINPSTGLRISPSVIAVFLKE
jgi:5-methylcytosine-specific restriction endonuclease McrA